MTLRDYPRRYDMVVDLEGSDADPFVSLHWKNETVVQFNLPREIIAGVLDQAEFMISVRRQRDGEISKAVGFDEVEKTKEDVCVLLNGEKVNP